MSSEAQRCCASVGMPVNQPPYAKQSRCDSELHQAWPKYCLSSRFPAAQFGSLGVGESSAEMYHRRLFMFTIITANAILVWFVWEFLWLSAGSLVLGSWNGCSG